MRRMLHSGAKFLAVGALSTVIELATFNLFVLAFGMDAVTAKVLSSLIALVNAYFGNREWAFRDRRAHTRRVEIALFLVVNAACTGVGAGIVAIGVLLVGDDHALVLNLVNLVSIAIVVVVRFVLYRGIVFRTTPFGAENDSATPSSIPQPGLRG